MKMTQEFKPKSPEKLTLRMLLNKPRKTLELHTIKRLQTKRRRLKKKS